MLWVYLHIEGKPLIFPLNLHTGCQQHSFGPPEIVFVYESRYRGHDSMQKPVTRPWKEASKCISLCICVRVCVCLVCACVCSCVEAVFHEVSVYPKKELPFFILFTAGLCSFTAMLALLTHQFPELMGVFAKAVSLSLSLTHTHTHTSRVCTWVASVVLRQVYFIEDNSIFFIFSLLCLKFWANPSIGSGPSPVSVP